jgi:Ca2+-binding EF-hand superfamily protein
MVRKKMANNSPQEMHEAFKAFNRSGGGFLNQADLRSVLDKMGESVTDEELTALIKEMDIDGDGKISFDEFQRMLVS